MNEKVKCDNCNSIDISESEIIKEKPILTMTEYTKSNSSRYNSPYIHCYGTSRLARMKLKCNNCGYEIEWDQVVYL